MDKQHAFAPGSRVIIRHNPHHPAATNVVGHVVELRIGEGFMGCDLAIVRYSNPGDGSTHEMPFGTANLDVGSPAALIKIAERYEAEAVELRRLAKEVTK